MSKAFGGVSKLAERAELNAEDPTFVALQDLSLAPNPGLRDQDKHPAHDVTE
jgi:hypothetical protein